MIEARAFWLTGRGRGALKPEEISYPGGEWCVIRAMFSAVSPGTERLVAMGRVPASLHREMRCPYMGGRFPFPVKYGYSLVGEVVQGPTELRGRVVHVLHPHQDFCVVRAGDVRPLPAGVPPARATLASNMETAITAAWDSGVVVGERALVIGFGVIGSLVARVLALGPAVDLTIVEARSDRRRLAESLGFRTADTALKGHFDVAFDTSGAAAGLRTAIESVGLEGRIVAVSWFGSDPVPLDLGGSFHSRRKRIIASQVSRIPGGLGPRWDAARRTELVFRLLERPELDLHIGPAVSFTELAKTYRSLIGRTQPGLSPLVIY